MLYEPLPSNSAKGKAADRVSVRKSVSFTSIEKLFS
jgi:hypothetical protein